MILLDHVNNWQFYNPGLVGYPSDDINKFLWMVRIGGGVFPHIKEPDYLVIFSTSFICYHLSNLKKKILFCREMVNTELMHKPHQPCSTALCTNCRIIGTNFSYIMLFFQRPKNMMTDELYSRVLGLLNHRWMEKVLIE